MSQQTSTRRRIDPRENEPPPVPRGCLIWGGVLGVAVGVLFGIFGLKPILQHFYGESTVGVGHAYSSGGREVQVMGVSTTGSNGQVPCTRISGDPAQITCVAVKVHSEKAWTDLSASKFTLQVTSQHSWVKATSLTSASGGRAVADAGKTVTLSIHFPFEKSNQLEYLHLSSPAVRFALQH